MADATNALLVRAPGTAGLNARGMLLLAECAHADRRQHDAERLVNLAWRLWDEAARRRVSGAAAALRDEIE